MGDTNRLNEFSSLRPGERVIVGRVRGSKYVSVVQKVTTKGIICLENGHKFYPDGRMHGSRDLVNGECLIVWSREEENRIKDIATINRAVACMHQTSCEDLSADQAERILAILLERGNGAKS